MMDDLINRQAAIDALKRHGSLFIRNRVDFLMLSEKDKARVDEIDTCISELLNLPTVQPERKKGKWETVDEEEPRRYGCSECKRLSFMPYFFCPNCGAEMVGET